MNGNKIFGLGSGLEKHKMMELFLKIDKLYVLFHILDIQMQSGRMLEIVP